MTTMTDDLQAGRDRRPADQHRHRSRRARAAHGIEAAIGLDRRLAGSASSSPQGVGPEPLRRRRLSGSVSRPYRHRENHGRDRFSADRPTPGLCTSTSARWSANLSAKPRRTCGNLRRRRARRMRSCCSTRPTPFRQAQRGPRQPTTATPMPRSRYLLRRLEPYRGPRHPDHEFSRPASMTMPPAASTSSSISPCRTTPRGRHCGARSWAI